MDAKILVVYHKQAPLVQNDVFIPIRVGASCNNNSSGMQNMLCDNTGENISDKNPIYNELTAIFWAWKNYQEIGNPDYIGLSHYRRHFIFNSSDKPYYEIKEIGEDFYQRINFSDKILQNLLQSGDFIAPMPSKRSSVRDNYNNAHNPKDLALAEQIIKKKYPDYTSALYKYLDGSKAYFYNMFIFDKVTFIRYCEWIFDILFEFEKTAAWDLDRMFISERLTGIFFTKLDEEGKKAVLLPTLFIRGKKESFISAIKKTRANIASKQSGLIYALKPIIVYFIPNFIMRAKRARKSK